MAQMKWGIANIYSSYNNIMITLTDITGAETLAKVTGGMIVKQAKDESSPYAAQKAADASADGSFDIDDPQGILLYYTMGLTGQAASWSDIFGE